MRPRCEASTTSRRSRCGPRGSSRGTEPSVMSWGPDIVMSMGSSPRGGFPEHLTEPLRHLEVADHLQIAVHERLSGWKLACGHAGEYGHGRSNGDRGIVAGARLRHGPAVLDPHAPATGSLGAGEVVLDRALEALRALGHERLLHPLEDHAQAGVGAHEAVELLVAAAAHERRERRLAELGELAADRGVAAVRAAVAPPPGVAARRGGIRLALRRDHVVGCRPRRLAPRERPLARVREPLAL